MKTLIIYDSYFGNTEKVAKSMSGFFVRPDECTVVRVDDFEINQLDDFDFLMVGSPTRGFRPTEKIKKFLHQIPPKALVGKKVAAFDTRVSNNQIKSPILKFLVNFFGYAANPIAKKLTQKGGELIGTPVGFLVKGTEGPLEENEIEKAALWLKSIIKNGDL